MTENVELGMMDVPRKGQVLPNGRRLALHFGGSFCPLQERGVMLMTYSELFQFCIVIISIINLFIQIKKK